MKDVTHAVSDLNTQTIHTFIVVLGLLRFLKAVTFYLFIFYLLLLLLSHKIKTFLFVKYIFVCQIYAGSWIYWNYFYMLAVMEGQKHTDGILY